MLLLYKGHYSLVTDFQRLICRRHMSIHVYQGHHETYCCHRCMRYFGKREKLDNHLALHNCVSDSIFKVDCQLPKLDEDGNVPVDSFTKVQMMLFNPVTVYADLEASLTPNDTGMTRGSKTEVLGCNQDAISVAYHTVGRDGFDVPKEHQAWLYRGVEPMQAFLLSLFRLYRSYFQIKEQAKDLMMTPDDQHLFDQAHKCYLCGSTFKNLERSSNVATTIILLEVSVVQLALAAIARLGCQKRL